jgi:hypothetical protein
MMKKSIAASAVLSLISMSAGVVVLLSGCSTPEMHSFNNDYGDNLVTRPNYYIKDENVDAGHFTIVVEQGAPSTGYERVVDVKKAATTIANSETARLGWTKWHMDYIQEKDQGWMHVVVAKVTREPPPTTQ